MAFNSWDKLSKAQRDYPKPKFAVAVVDKALKKNPKNPFLITWKADLSLQLEHDVESIYPQLQNVCRQPGLTDVRLLAYLYRIYLEAVRRRNPGDPSPGAIGDEGLKPWQNAAKLLVGRNDRMELWEDLFNTAMREECWEDVRTAVFNYNREGPPNKKAAHYTLILATQLAGEKKLKVLTEDLTVAAQVQFRLARTFMIKSYEASPDNPIAVKDIRDLRFMAEIFERQDRCAELLALWEFPPDALSNLMRTHRDDLTSIKTRILRARKDWPLLEKHCHTCIDDTISQLNLVQDSKSLWELCAWNWDIWDALQVSMTANHTESEAIEKMLDVMDRCFGAEFKAKDRALRLTYTRLRQFTNTLTLTDCKEFWEHHSSLGSCFSDLRSSVEYLCVADQFEFCHWIVAQAKDVGARSDPEKYANEEWEFTEHNVLRFEYLLSISLPINPEWDAMERLVARAVGFSASWPNRAEEGGWIAIYTLLKMHHHALCLEEARNPFEVTPNSRILLQATMLARHLVATDKDKQSRKLALLAARLHLNLGLGKCAFKLYGHTKCKEMLLDTLSPYVLSRISITHPFEIKGYQGFSAEEELTKVISTIERMERKADSFLYVDMPSFVWDQAEAALGLKKKLKTSLTKLICISERRRMARLKGESVENLAVPDYRNYFTISDNIDRSVFPSIEFTEHVGPLQFVMPNCIPNSDGFVEDQGTWDYSSSYLYREGSLNPHLGALKYMASMRSEEEGTLKFKAAEQLPVESSLKELWACIDILTCAIVDPGRHMKLLQQRLREVLEIQDDIRLIRQAMEKLRMPSSTTLKPEDEPTMFHENMLMSSYTKLEVLRALNKLVEHLREKVINAKSSHPLKAKLPKDWVADLADETQICFEAIRDVAKSYIELIKKRGAAAIRAQVRWGHTGKVLSQLLSDDDVDFYTSEYVESAQAAWDGVLKIKLK